MSKQLMLRQSINTSRQALHQKFNAGMLEFIKEAFKLLLTIELPAAQLKGLEISIKDSTRFALPEIMVHAGIRWSI
ncbi:hypothetical protein [Mucilaginibacter oryzae]|uniref:hypothetical protein n=1 Tax=Mucilaginibacter oryzae TaxID=468058 RepID=UPI000D6C23DE|nr:hypothetical protein [Mucilaginibacter oryzae]